MALHGMFRYSGAFRLFPRYSCIAIQKNYASVSRPLNTTEEPIKYSKTKASKMTRHETFFKKPNPAILSIERYIILVALLTSFIYFGFLREENKWDEIVGGTYNYEEDDEVKLLNALLHAKLKGLKTDDIEQKLKEVRGH